MVRDRIIPEDYQVKKLVIYFIIIILSLSCSSSVKSFDPNVEIDVTEPHFIFNDEGQVIFVFKTKQTVKLDAEIHTPIFFELPLPNPEQVKNFSIAGMDKFIFFYKGGQTVLVKTPFINKRDFGMTTYEPENKIIEELIEVELSKYYKKENNDLNISYRSIKYNPDRYHQIKNNGLVQIILTNIKEENISLFTSSLEGFRLIK